MTDRQILREADGQAQIYIDKETGRHRNTDREDIKIEKEIDIQTEKEADIQTDT